MKTAQTGDAQVRDAGFVQQTPPNENRPLRSQTGVRSSSSFADC
jgi:hypothetical protein